MDPMGPLCLMPKSIDQNGKQDDPTKNDLLRITIKLHQVHPILNDRDDQCTDERSEHRAIAPPQ